MANDCKTCLHYRVFQGEKCVRDMTMVDGRVVRVSSAGRATFQERDESLAIWRKGSLQRKGGKHWERRA
jgi:hypothetical protein